MVRVGQDESCFEGSGAPLLFLCGSAQLQYRTHSAGPGSGDQEAADDVARARSWGGKHLLEEAASATAQAARSNLGSRARRRSSESRSVGSRASRTRNRIAWTCGTAVVSPSACRKRRG